MILFVAWLMLGIELVVSASFGVVFWRLWSRSAMSRGVALTAIMTYGFCCLLCVLLTFFVPL